MHVALGDAELFGQELPEPVTDHVFTFYPVVRFQGVVRRLALGAIVLGK